MTKRTSRKKGGLRGRLARLSWPRWLKPWRRHILAGAAVLVVAALGSLTYLWVHYSRIVDARLHGERDRVVPRVFARPLTLHAGQGVSLTDLVADLRAATPSAAAEAAVPDLAAVRNGIAGTS